MRKKTRKKTEKVQKKDRKSSFGGAQLLWCAWFFIFPMYVHPLQQEINRIYTTFLLLFILFVCIFVRESNVIKTSVGIQGLW